MEACARDQTIHPSEKRTRSGPAPPEMGSLAFQTHGLTFSTLTWMGFRPERKAERLGEQYLKA